MENVSKIAYCAVNWLQQCSLHFILLLQLCNDELIIPGTVSCCLL